MAEATFSPAPTAQPGALGQVASLPALAGDWRARISGFLAQPAVRRSLPALAGLGALAALAALYFSLADGPQRILYSSLSDGERAQVVETLEAGGIDYRIDPATGMVTVPEDDLYRARMLVASDGSLAPPETAIQMLDSMPLGSSRMLESERLRLARERELTLTILEIDGIEAARVHLATPEKSVFVRDRNEPSASVMVRLAKGRELSAEQVDAIVNLVAASVPGMNGSMVRLVDQKGRLLSSRADPADEALDLQQAMEAKLRGQLAALLVPMLGEGRFSTEVQVELEREELTSAREVYDQQPVVRNESESRSVTGVAAAAQGIPGALSNTPPPDPQLVEGAPEGTLAPGAEQASQSQSSSERSYAVGREVAVSSKGPGSVARISVAVVLDEQALKKIAPANADRVRELVEAAVGADPARGDKVTVITGKFEPASLGEVPFYEQPWFNLVLRYGSALLAVLLALLLGVRPLLKMLRPGSAEDDGEGQAGANDLAANADGARGAMAGSREGPSAGISSFMPSRNGMEGGGEAIGAAALANPHAGELHQQIALVQQLAEQQPDRAVHALRRMLAAPSGETQP